MERLTVNDLDKVCYDPWELCGMDRYCKKGCHEEGGCTKGCHILKMYRKLAEYENLEDEKKLLKLPCAVGDTVYYLTGNSTHSRTPKFNRVEKSKVQGFYFDEKGLQIRLNYDWHGNHGTYGFFGKTVFLTREQAEAALKELEGTE